MACLKETIKVNMLESDGTDWHACWTIPEDNLGWTILVDFFVMCVCGGGGGITFLPTKKVISVIFFFQTANIPYIISCIQLRLIVLH